jgi:leader peptidase (prepilin peptidase) / N-methyltransferase
VTLQDFPAAFFRVFALLFGLVWGSFLNVVIHRLPRDLSVVRPASRCPHCDTPIAAYRNIPVLSWVLMRGRSVCCKKPVSARYVVVEILAGLLSLAVLEVLVLSLPGSSSLLHAGAVYVAALALALGLLAAAFIDLEHMIIPDSISIGGALLGLATFSIRGASLPELAIGTVVGFVVVWLPCDVLYRRLRGTPGMGLGDAKLVMLAGAWFGVQGALFALFAGAFQATVVVLVMHVLGLRMEEPEAVRREREEILAELEKLEPEERAELEAEWALDPLAAEAEEGWGKTRIAFGPFLILAILECLLITPQRLMQWLP